MTPVLNHKIMELKKTPNPKYEELIITIIHVYTENYWYCERKTLTKKLPVSRTMTESVVLSLYLTFEHKSSSSVLIQYCSALNLSQK